MPTTAITLAATPRPSIVKTETKEMGQAVADKNDAMEVEGVEKRRIGTREAPRFKVAGCQTPPHHSQASVQKATRLRLVLG